MKLKLQHLKINENNTFISLQYYKKCHSNKPSFVIEFLCASSTLIHANINRKLIMITFMASGNGIQSENNLYFLVGFCDDMLIHINKYWIHYDCHETNWSISLKCNLIYGI